VLFLADAWKAFVPLTVKHRSIPCFAYPDHEGEQKQNTTTVVEHGQHAAALWQRK
jgi:hypothetical protein